MVPEGATTPARENPVTNVLLGTEYLAGLHQDTGSWRVASAAYYGGLGTVEHTGLALPTTWAAAASILTVVPDPAAGNVLTLAQYAQAVAAHAAAAQPVLAAAVCSGKGAIP